MSYKHPYAEVKMNRIKNDFDGFLNEVIKTYNKTAFELSSGLSGFTCIRKYTALIFHKDFLNVLSTRLGFVEAEIQELEQAIAKLNPINLDAIDLGGATTGEDILIQLNAQGVLDSLVVRYLQRVADNLDLYRFRNRKTPFYVQINLRETLIQGHMMLDVGMHDHDVDWLEAPYQKDSRRFYKKDINHKKFDQIQARYPDLNIEVFKLVHRHCYHLLSLRTYPAIDLLELNTAPKNLQVRGLFSPTELLAYDDAGNLSELITEFSKNFPLHKEQIKRAVEVMKFEFPIRMANTSTKAIDEITGKDYIYYDISVRG